MKLKRMALLGICILLLASVLVGCGGDTDKADSDEVVLKFGLWDKYQQPILREIADKYEAENPGVKIDIQLTPFSQYWTKLETAATGGVLPDIFWMNGPNIVKYASNDMILPISENVEKDSMDLSVYPEGLINLYTVGDKLYGIPKDWDLTALWYNKEIFDAKGVEYPTNEWTWDDMVEAARKLTDESEGTYGIAARPMTQEGIYDTIPQAGGYIISEDRTKSGYDTEEAIKGTQIWLDLIEEGLSPTLEELTDTNGVEMFKSGKLAMVYAASWNVPVFMDNENIKDVIDLVEMPIIKERAATIHGLSNVISANTKYPEEAWDFVKYLGGKEANEVWAKSGAVIPARKDVLEIWEESNPNINLHAFTAGLEYSVMYPVSQNTAKWNDLENEYIKQMWHGNLTAEEGLKKLAEGMNKLLEQE